MDARRGILSDTLDHARFSEHAQALAILADLLGAEETSRAIAPQPAGLGRIHAKTPSPQ